MVCCPSIVQQLKTLVMAPKMCDIFHPLFFTPSSMVYCCLYAEYSMIIYAINSHDPKGYNWFVVVILIG